MYTSFLSLTISLFTEFLGRRRSQRATKILEKNKITKLYTNLSLFSVQFLLAGPNAVFIGTERTLQKTNRWPKSGIDWPRFAVDPRQGAALLWPLDPKFLFQVCYEVVIHVAFQNLQLLRGSLWILISNLGFILILNLIPLIIAN